jgi:DNA-binding transcriptional ArsR family regulator
MLHVLVEPAHHPEPASWVAAVRRAVAPDLLDRIAESNVLWRSSRADFLLPGRPRPDLRLELDDVDALTDEAWVGAALNTTSCGSVPLRPAVSLLQDRAARALAREVAQARGPAQAAFADRILDDPDGTRAWVRQLLEDCEVAFFADEWRRLLPRLTADARHKGDLAQRHGLAEAVSAVSSTVRYDGPGQRLVVDKLQDATAEADGGVVFLPSAFGAPHLLVVYAPGWRPVVQYPTTSQGGASLDGVEGRLRALDHPVRLRLLRTLMRGAHTTGELAVAWNLTPPEVSRHLAVLKRAGLITAHREGRFVRYRLDIGATARIGTDLIDTLLR